MQHEHIKEMSFKMPKFATFSEIKSNLASVYNMYFSTKSCKCWLENSKQNQQNESSNYNLGHCYFDLHLPVTLLSSL